MKHYLKLGFLIFLTLQLIGLTGCATKRSVTMRVDLTQESWMREVDTNPNKWLRGADQWFLSGNPTPAELAVRRAPYSAAVSTLSVRVPNFSKIKVNGDFQVQIFGTEGPNSVYVLGTNDSIRNISVQVRGDTLCVEQAKKSTVAIRNIIIRIGVNRLNEIVHLGGGCVEGVNLRSGYQLNILSAGSGHLYLAGDMNVRKIVKTGSGNVTVLGANTPLLDIKAAGFGDVNVNGKVGVRSIIHHGRTDVNIIGANTDLLSIFADGRGKVGVVGNINLREIRAKDLARVYVYQVSSPAINIYAYGQAKIGIAGFAKNIYIDAFKQTCVGAKDLCAEAAYVRSHDAAHINISGNKIFAAATQNSSIYFFGSPAVMSQFVSGNGVVIPIWAPSKYCPVLVQAVTPVVVRSDYKHENRKPIHREWKAKPKTRKPVRVFRGEG